MKGKMNEVNIYVNVEDEMNLKVLGGGEKRVICEASTAIER